MNSTSDLTSDSTSIPTSFPLIGIAGRAGHGKSTAAEMLVSFGFTRLAFATRLKRTMGEMFGRDLSTGECKKEVCDLTGLTYGRMFQLFGQGMRSLLSPTIWIDLLFRDLSFPLTRPVVIEDVRFPEEVTAIRKRGGVILLIRRNGVTLSDGRVSSEEDVIETLHRDFIISNDGTMDDLRRNLDRLISHFLVPSIPPPPPPSTDIRI